MSRDLDGKHLQKMERNHTDDAGYRPEDSREDRSPDCLKSILGEIEEVRTNLKRILMHFNGGKQSSLTALIQKLPVRVIAMKGRC